MSIAEKLVTIAENMQSVYDKGFLEGLAKAKAEGRKTEYVQEYFTGSKQYLTYSIDFEPKLIFFQSGESNTTVLENKPDIDVATLNIPNLMVKSAEDFVEGQEYPFIGATVWRYKKAEDTLAYDSSNSSYINYTFNQTTGKWDITLGRADSSTTATRFVSSGQVPSQILFIGKAEPSVLEGTVTITESTKELKIEGLPKAPKTFAVVSPQSTIPATDDIQFIKSLEYREDGIGKKGNMTILAIITTLTSTNVSTSNFDFDTITEKMNTNQNLITFENGVFTIKMHNNSKARFAQDFTYRWIATF